MNIIIVHDYAFSEGGAAKIAFDIAKMMAARGHRVIFFSAMPPISPDLVEHHIEVICLNQQDILHDPNRIRAVFQGLWNFKAAHKMRKLLSSLSPNDTILHVHALQKALSSSVVHVAHKMGFPIVYHLHDYGIACPNMGFFDYPAQKICYRRAMSIDCLFRNCDSRSYPQKCWRILRQYVQTYFGGIPSFINSVIYISDYSMEFLRPYLPPKQRKYFLSNPLDVQKLDRVKAEIHDAFLFVGRLSPEKNPSLLARAAYELNVPVVFIGKGNKPEEEEYLRQLNPKASFLGWVPHEQLYRYMSQARALVFPSIWGETQGLSAFEAQAYGLPVIVSNECAAREAVIGNKTGILFQNNSLSDLKYAMQQLMDNTIAKDMSCNAYTNFWNHYRTSDEYADCLEKIYHETIQYNH